MNFINKFFLVIFLSCAQLMVFELGNNIIADCCQSTKDPMGIRKCTSDGTCGHCKYAYRLVKYSSATFTAFVDPNGKYPAPSSPGWNTASGAANMSVGSCPSCGHAQSDHICDGTGNINPDYQNTAKALTTYP
ncbi:MAG: hypothetical protein P4L31_07875 [Candidatus Babeliales bacterium]|nr:hypothetical protein [Candidatus Babeliales bacterium]